LANAQSGYKFASPKEQLITPGPVTKADVIAEIAEKTGIDKADVTASVEAFFTVVKNAMANGSNIYVRGFGSFVNKKRKRKIARNISRNTALVIEEHFIPSFKPAKIFINKIKNSDKVKQAARAAAE
jgi:DNA-binding protein HU-beta